MSNTLTNLLSPIVHSTMYRQDRIDPDTSGRLYDSISGITCGSAAGLTPSRLGGLLRTACIVIFTLLLLSGAKTAYACGGCFQLPYQSLLERVEQGSRVVVARPNGLKGSAWKIEAVIKGSKLIDGETIAAKKLNLRSKTTIRSAQVLTWNRTFDTWTIEAAANRELIEFLRAGTALSTMQVEPINLRNHVGQIRFFLPYLEHRDVNIADSAHAKLSKAPYAALQGLADDLDTDQLRTWIDSQPATGTKRVALSVVLLGICGGQRETDSVEKWINDCSGGGDPAYLTALLTAHVELVGEPAVRFLEQSYIRNRDRTLGEVIAAIDALRTHGQADSTISRDRIKASFQLLLRERPPLLETVIEDFARWEDWSITPQLIEIYAGGKQPWNNAMIIQYLQTCPHPEAKRFLKRLASDDASAR